MTYIDGSEILEEIARAVAAGADWPSSNATELPLLQPALAIARRMQRIFRLPVPDAPGLAFVGGQFDAATFEPSATGSGSVSVAGSSMEPMRAFLSCICEAVEYVSQLKAPEHDCIFDTAGNLATGLEHGQLTALLAGMGADPAIAAAQMHWIAATNISEGEKVLLPASLCLRNTDGAGRRDPSVKLSTGCGAGPTRATAMLHGLLELVERDAVAMWWLGGRRGKALACGAESEAADYMAQLRQQSSGRTSWLLDISTDLAIPSVAALSHDADGRGLAFGFAARLSFEEAAKAAIRELCQMELGLHLLSLKLHQQGAAALNSADKLYLRRACDLDVGGCALLHPKPGPGQSHAAFVATGNDAARHLARHLGQHGITAFWADMTRPALAIPAGKALAIGLQPYPSGIVSARLQRQIDETGGGFGLSDGVELM